MNWSLARLDFETAFELTHDHLVAVHFRLVDLDFVRAFKRAARQAVRFFAVVG